MSLPEEQKKEPEEETTEDREKKLERLKNMISDQEQDAAKVLKMWLQNDNDR